MRDPLTNAKHRLRRATRTVAQQVQQGAAIRPWDFITATVTATSPLTLTYADGTVDPDVPRLASYTPTNGDVVLVLVRAPVATVLGKLA